MPNICKSIGWKIIVLITVFSILVGGLRFISIIEAASLSDSSDTISDSSPGATAVTHTFDFTITQDIPANGNIFITFDASFDLSSVGTGDVTCPVAGSTTTIAGQTIECATTTAQTATSAIQVIIADVDSPAKSNATGVADVYTNTIQTRNASDVVIESAEVMVAIIDTVTMSANVAAVLDFRISGTTTGAVINNATTTVVATTTTIPFGTVSPGAANYEIGGQQLAVITNADGGFVVTVEQDGNLRTAGSADIDSFDDGTPQTTPAAWSSPAGTLGSEETYGHMGLTSNDANLSSDSGSYPDFSGSLFGGFNGTNSFVVFASTGPADGITQNIGLASVAYKVEINTLQETGDYTNTLTYICTPTY
jgi:hypothetical protein